MFNHVNASWHSILKGHLVRVEDRSSSATTERKGQKDSNSKLLGIVKKFCNLFETEIMISICLVHDSDYTKMTLLRVANFQVKHLNSDF